MPASRAGLFDSLRRLLRTTLELVHVRLELLISDLEIEKQRFVDAALRALIGVMLLGLGLVLLIGLLLMLLWDSYGLPALALLTLLCLAGGLLLLQGAKHRLQRSEEMFAATRAELERDQAALRGGLGDNP